MVAMTKKIKPTKRRPSGRGYRRETSEKLVEGARNHVLDAYDEAVDLLTEKESLELIASLREDLDLRQSDIEYAIEARRRRKGSKKS